MFNLVEWRTVADQNPKQYGNHEHYNLWEFHTLNSQVHGFTVCVRVICINREKKGGYDTDTPDTSNRKS